jgi:hypothetical protein
MGVVASNDATYSGAGQQQTPVASSVNPNLLALTMGGTRVASVVAALLQLNSLQDNLQTAKNYYTVNLTDFNFWNTTYNPRMASSLAEGMQRPFYTNNNFTPPYGALDYLASTGRGQSKASLKIDREWFQTRRRVSKYTIGIGRRVDYKFAITKFNSELEGWNLGFRYEDHRKMMYDEQRHAHQAEILNVGIGAGNAARQGLATAVRGVSEARMQKAGQFGSLSNGLASFAGNQEAAQGIKQQKQQSNSTSANIPYLSQPMIDLKDPGDKIFSSGMEN